MRASKSSEVLIAFILKQAKEGTAVCDICPTAAVSEGAFYCWRKRYSGVDAVRDEAAV